MATSLYLDAFSGISGDMFIGALLDLGLDFNEFKRRLALLNVPGYEINAKRVAHSSIYGTNFDTVLSAAGKDDAVVTAEEAQAHHHHEPHRHLSDIKQLINQSKLSDSVKAHAIAVFTDIAQAEAKVHDRPLEAVHFHEVGALDSIVDIVGAFVALEMLDVTDVYCSEIADGSGFIKVAHGIMPVPVPAVMQMRVGTTIPIRQETNIRTELVTPTGMGIIKEIVTGFGPLPKDWEITGVGYGFGNRQIPQFNALRVLKCKKKTLSNQVVDAHRDQVISMAANIDDQSPETLGPMIDLLMEKGALDAYFTPIQMKKSRPAIELTVLMAPQDLDRLTALIFKMTTTIGVRFQFLDRFVMARSFRRVMTKYGVIKVKTAKFHGIEKTSPEFEDCLKAARKYQVSLQDVYQAVYQSL